MRALIIAVPLVLAALAPEAAARRYAYVLNQGDPADAYSSSVSVVDVDSASVTATIPVRFEPVAIAVQPDGLRAYVTSSSTNAVQVIDTTTNTVIADLTSLGTGPAGIAVDPSGTHVYVGFRTEDFISVFETANPMAPATQIPAGRMGAVLMAVDKDANQIFVGYNDGALATIDIASNAIQMNATAGLANIVGLASYGYYPPGRGVVLSDGSSAVLSRPDGTGRLTLVNSRRPWDVSVRLSLWNLPEVWVVEQNAADIRLVGPGTTFGTMGSSPVGIAYSDDDDVNANDQAFVVVNGASDSVAIIKVDAGTTTTVPVGLDPTRVATGPVLRALFRFLPTRLSFTFADLQPRFQVLKIHNGGHDVLIPSKPTIEGRDALRFSVSADGCAGKKLQPGASCSVTVRFAPASLGASYSATMSFTSADPKVRGSVPLSGMYDKSSK